MSITPENREPSGTGVSTARYRDAFLVADELSVHGSECVCPNCAARLTGLLTELAHAIRKNSSD